MEILQVDLNAGRALVSGPLKATQLTVGWTTTTKSNAFVQLGMEEQDVNSVRLDTSATLLERPVSEIFSATTLLAA